MRGHNILRRGLNFPMGKMISGTLRTNDNIITTGARWFINSAGAVQLDTPFSGSGLADSAVHRVDFRDLDYNLPGQQYLGPTLGRWYGFSVKWQAVGSWESNVGRSIFEFGSRPDDEDGGTLHAPIRLFVPNSFSTFRCYVSGDSEAFSSGNATEYEVFDITYDTAVHTLTGYFKPHYTPGLGHLILYLDGVKVWDRSDLSTTNNDLNATYFGVNSYVYGQVLRTTPPATDPVTNIFSQLVMWEERPVSVASVSVGESGPAPEVVP